MSRSILIKPIISEKSEKLTAKGNQYTFVVDKKANKIEIKKAVESMFTTNVVAVNTVIVPARLKSRNTRSGVVRGSISAYKKAYVTLAAGEELDIYGTTEE
ncbi:MAG: 50S ribosomal protein L23 [Saprospiraceae bacterium]|nr:50S ribosomal protein L23 [Saprospiraceae bacterium]MBK8669458.1 50S ribosomal protein L23 [Saprospiraceae bacterium]MBL0100792.1 50S ribosomal protein L23 [Saprospiraceae bacterium]